jgi:hypothetical protein
MATIMISSVAVGFIKVLFFDTTTAPGSLILPSTVLLHTAQGPFDWVL